MNRQQPRRPRLSVDDYLTGVRSRDVAVFPRALTLIESQNAEHQRQAEELLTRILPYTGNSIRVGISGSPGAGKSTLIEALGLYLIDRGHRVAVLAVDPSSGVSGGSILGDKTRMPHLSANPHAYIRPSPSAGTLGGVAAKTRESMLVCEAAGFDVILIETVGVGQSETVVDNMTDCFLALMLPGAGDELQGIKRGLLELVDVIAVNKADGGTLQAAELAARQLKSALASLSSREGELPPVLTCSALHQTGVDTLWEAVKACYATMKVQGTLTTRRQRQRADWLWALVDDRLRRAIRTAPAVTAIREDLERKVVAGTIAPEAAARRIFEIFVADGERK